MGDEGSFAGTGGRPGSVTAGEGGAMPDISIRGLDGTREPALGREEDRAEDAALPGRLGPTSVASGASSESEEDELEEDEDEDEEECRCTERVLDGGSVAEADGRVHGTEEDKWG